MSQAELFMAGGAALVVLTDLIFVILGPYAFSNVILASAMAVLVLVLVRRRLSIGSFDWLLIGIVTIGSLMAVRELFSDLVFLVRLSSPDIGILLGMVGLYVGVGLMAFGAWQLYQRRRT